jgi:hypothetical protein
MHQLYKSLLVVMMFTCLVFNTAAQAPPSPVFYKTHNSDEWVRQTLHIQRRYTRVCQDALAGYLKNVEGAIGTYDLHAVQPALFSTPLTRFTNHRRRPMPHAAASIAVMPGTYAGFVMGDKPTSDGRYIHVGRLQSATYSSTAPRAS